MTCRLSLPCIIRALGLLTLSLVLASCSVVRLGYGQLPELIYWWVDGYLDLDDGQSSLLRQDLEKIHEWHRRQELPPLANTLATLQTQAVSDVTPAQLCGWVDALKPRIGAVLDQAEPGLATLATRLTPEQLAHLQHQLDKRQQQWRDEWLKGNDAERQARRLERLIDRAEDFYGPLSTEQQTLLRTGVANSPFDLALAQAEMLRRQQDVYQTLQTLASGRLSPAQARAEVHQWLTRVQTSPNPAYRTNMTRLTQANCDSFAALHNSASSNQRQRLVSRLKGFEDDARALAPASR